MRTPERLAARREIIQTANNWRYRNFRARGHMAELWTARHIYQAIAVCRHNGLVKPQTLETAGFNVR